MSLTKYTPSKGLFFGGIQVMTPATVARWSNQFNAPPKTLGGLKLYKPHEIIDGGSIGYRPENQSYTTVGRSMLFNGGDSSVVLQQQEHSPIVHKQLTPLQSTESSIFRPQIRSSIISTPTIASSQPVMRSPYYRSIDPHGLANYLDIRYEDLSREIERARFQRKLERMEDEYKKERRKTPTKRAKRKTPKRKTTGRKKAKSKKRK
tara:strand:- start:611 stop:1228 length:618 start_codon:yes stop_codon:yes gene_type:complete